MTALETIMWEAAQSGPTHTAFLGALIGGAVSLIGGMSARSKAKKDAKRADEAAKVPMVTETAHKVDLKGMNEAAIAAGYNPMTILNAGGLSAFTKSTNTTTGHNAMAAAEAHANVPSFGSVVAGAAGTAVQSLEQSGAFKNFAPMSKGYFPPAPGGGGLTTLSAVLGAGGGLSRTAAGGKAGGTGVSFYTAPTLSASNVAAGGFQPPKMEPGTKVNPHKWIKVDPTMASAEDWEMEYSDPGGWVGAMLNFDANLKYTLSGITSQTRWDMMRGAFYALKSGALSYKTLADRAEKVWGNKAPPKPPVKDNFNDPFPAWQW